ncbi:PAS domain S-box protein, partial [Escherichia coli]|uniref:PAS domain S-box protein n=1 Tax=Escherichia coli TaxID=562 RepID=UPI00339849DD
EWVHVQLHQQKGMISLSPPTICNSAVLIEWRSDDPGRALMKRELPLIIILMLSTIAFTWLMRRGALIKAQINDENVFLLEQSRQALTASERRFRDVIEATTGWIWEADSEARLTWLSDRFSGVTGHHSDDWLGRNMLDFIHSDKILFHHWLLNPQTSSNWGLRANGTKTYAKKLIHCLN